MHPAIRTQADNQQDAYSDASQLEMTTPDTTRQEFKDETDINSMLKRMLLQTSAGEPRYTETDFDMDLQQARRSISNAEEMHRSLPQHLKDKYPTWQSFFDAIAREEVTSFEIPNVTPAPTEPVTP